MDEHSLVRPIGRQVEGAAVESRSVVAHDTVLFVAVHSTWRFVLERVARVVVGRLAVAGHLPVHGHLDDVPALVVIILCLELACSGALVGARYIAESPLAVQVERHGVGGSYPRTFVILVSKQSGFGRVGDECGMTSFTVHANYMLVLNPLDVEIRGSMSCKAKCR